MKTQKFAVSMILLATAIDSVTRGRAGDFAEGNTTNWGTFASDAASTSVTNDTTHVRAGSCSLRFDTLSGFGTGVTYPKDASAHWDLTTNTHLIFWSYGENNTQYGFQGNQPVIVLKSVGGSYRYEPDHMITTDHQWTLVKVPLAGDAHWTRTATGSPTLTNVTQLGIHQDTWDQGFTIYYDGVQFVTLGTNTPSPPTSPAGVNPDAMVQRVLLFIYDPVMENKGGKRMHQAYGWTDPQVLTQGIIHDFNSNSHGLYLPQIIETQIVDEYPALLDGFRYDDASYDQAYQTWTWHDSGFDYWRFMVEQGLVPRVESGDIDEIWIYGAPYWGTYESTFAGYGGYWCNSGPVSGATNQHLVVIMGWNYERGVSEALESFGHRTESIMRKIYDNNWDFFSRTNAWSAFALYDKNAPGLGGVGNVHYPVNGQSDYDWANTNFVWSTCDAWMNYPDLTNAPRLVNYREWAPDDTDISRNYLNWWYGHFPHVSGKAPAPDDRLNNWWRYLIDVDQFKLGNGALAGVSGIGFAQITAPANQATVSGIVPVTVDANVDGALGRVDLYVDGIFYASDSLAPFTFEWNTDGLIGAHMLTAKAYELQSGAESASAPVTVNVLGATITGQVLTNAQPLEGVTLTARGSVKRWLRQSASPAAPIPDNNLSGGTSVISISATGMVADVQVGVTLRHPRRSDLRVTLVHPGGASVRLRSEGGGADRDLIAFYPNLTAPEESLSRFAGLPVAGDWKLVVADLASGMTGQIESWSLAFNYREPQMFVTTSGPDGNFSLTNLPAGDYELRPAKSGYSFVPIVTNLTVAANGTNIVFVVGPNDPPVILTPPQNQTVIAGTNVTLTVVAAGTGPLRYQWFFNGAVIPGATEAALSLSNLIVDASGIYSVIVSNPIPAGAAASATLTVLPTPFLADACEGHAGDWVSFVPAWENATSSVANDTTRVHTGTQSVGFVTTSGFDTGVKFPATAAHWDLRNTGWLSFWAYADNNTPYGFQGPQPVIGLNCAGGSLTLTPNDQLMANHDWTFFRIPLNGNATWSLSISNAPNLADANQIEIHQDTWDAGFTVYYDGLQFEPKPILTTPEFQTNGLWQLFATVPAGVACTLQTSTDLEHWANLETRTNSLSLEAWQVGPTPDNQFYRVRAE
jgi:subtilisin-like proprotein convertase family protein